MHLKNNYGFTLVELGIVMLIIGVLAVGILKGRELIVSSRITASISQIQEIDLAFSKFWDKYENIPGDMPNPAARLVNCAGQCAFAGNGNNRIDRYPDASQILNNEATSFWAQLAAAGMIEGISTNPSAIAGGESHPEFPIGGALRVGNPYNGLFAASTSAALRVSGPREHYLATGGNLNSVSGLASATALTPEWARRIDEKIDDSLPNSGKVLGISVGAAASRCATASDATGVYDIASDILECDIYVQINK